MDYCCTNYDVTKVINVYKGIFKEIGFLPQIKMIDLLRIKQTEIMFDVKNMTQKEKDVF